MRNINLFGTIFGISGYDNHCRQLLKALYEKNKNIHLECQRPDRWEIGVEDYIFKSISNPVYEDGVTIAVALPHQWPMMWDTSKDFIGFCVWEGDKVPAFWIEYLMNPKVKQIWVPSEHTKEAIFKTFDDINKDGVFIMTDKVKVVPHGVDTELFKPGEKPRNWNDGIMERDGTPKVKPYTFIMNKGWRAGINDRGGVQWALKAFSEEFSEDEPVELIVKINPAYNPPNWHLQEELDKIGVKHKNIKFALEAVPFNKLPELYHMGDCFVSTSMAEAFNLPVAEAMSCGLPVIITDFGGQTDFVPKNNSIVPTTLVDANDGVMYEGIKWAKPDMKSLKAQLRLAVNAKTWSKNTGIKNREYIKNWTWDNSANKALKYIDSIYKS